MTPVKPLRRVLLIVGTLMTVAALSSFVWVLANMASHIALRTLIGAWVLAIIGAPILGYNWAKFRSEVR